MDDFQERLGAILANPQLMGQIMSMAQSMGQNQGSAPPPPPPRPNPPGNGMPDFSMLQGLMNPMQGKPNKQQQNLLNALRPFLAADKLQRLERALQAARLAQMATAMLGQMNGGKQVNHV